MIDERHEELASLYVLGLLEGLEKTAFETVLARSPELQALVRDLRESSAALAHLPPSPELPPEFKEQLLAEIQAPRRRSPTRKIVAFPTWIPWGIAASFAILALWVGQLHLTNRSEMEVLRHRQALADVTLKNLQNQLEAERIVAKQELAGLTEQVANANRQLAEARQAAESTETLLATARQSATNAEAKLADTLQRSRELERLLTSTRTQIASLNERLKTEGDIARLKITTLASMLRNSPDALAVVVWNPSNQEGMLKAANFPTPPPDKEYQLWMVDSQYPDPVDGGTFTVDAAGEALIPFRAKRPIKAANAYAITLENKGGVEKSDGPFLLLSKEP
jgi:anti-sigma-K factor RskA